MMKQHPCWARPLVVAFLVGSAVAQQTLVVGIGGTFNSIQQAIAASAPGDTIVVRPLVHSPHLPFVLNHSLTIRNDPAFAVTLIQPSTIQIGPNDQVHLQGLIFIGNGFISPAAAVTTISGGLVTLENTTFVGQTLSTPVLEVTNSRVVLRRHAQTGLFSCRDSDVVALDSDFQGTDGAVGSYESPGIAALRSTVRLSSCRVTCGGSSALATSWWAARGIASSALSLVASQCSLVDCQVRSAPFLEPTAVVDATSTLLYDRVTFLPGSGTGTGIVGNAQPAILLGATMPELEPNLGSTLTAAFSTQPLAPVFVLATLRLAPPVSAPLVQPEHWGFAGPQGVVVGLLIADAIGHCQQQVPLPANPSLLGIGLWLMGASGPTLPLQLSVPVGGLLR